MKFLILVLLFISSTADADIHRCMIGNKPTYQDKPCVGETKPKSPQQDTTSSMTGCYSIDFPGWESGTNNEKFRVTSIGNGEYKMDDIGKKSSNMSIPMKNATPEELKVVGDAFKFSANEGISMKWNKDTPNQKPIGFYRGTDIQGQAIVFAFFFLSNGIAKEILCP